MRPARAAVTRAEVDPPVTAASVLAAQQATALERARIYEATGIQIDDSGRIVRPAKAQS